MERPYLQAFLDYAFQNFNVSVFTAADKDYGSFIINNIIEGRKRNRRIHYFLHGFHSEISEAIYKTPKQLTILWDLFKLPNVNNTNTVIVDDNQMVIESNPFNVIPAPEFEILKDDGEVNYKSLCNE